MICDVLKEIDSVYHFKEICEKIFDDPREYIKLTDNIIERVEDMYD